MWQQPNKTAILLQAFCPTHCHCTQSNKPIPVSSSSDQTSQKTSCSTSQVFSFNFWVQNSILQESCDRCMGKIIKSSLWILSSLSSPFSCWAKKGAECSLFYLFPVSLYVNSRERGMIRAYTSKTKTKPNKKALSHALLWSLQTSVFFLNPVHIPLFRQIKWEFFGEAHQTHFKIHKK